MTDASPEEARIGSRDEQRFPVGTIIEAVGRPGRIRVQVIDLSLAGALVRSHGHRLTPGDCVLLDLSLAPQRARIVWAKASVAGCQFEEQLHPVVLKLILKGLRPEIDGSAEDDAPTGQVLPGALRCHERFTRVA